MSFQVGIDAQVIQAHLSTLEVGAEVSYDELSALISRDVRGPARYCLTTALRRLLTEGKVWGTVRSVGIRRLSDHEILGLGEESVSRIRRASRRGRTKLHAVQDFAALPPEEKIRHNTLASMLGVLEHLSTSRSMSRLEGKVKELQSTLPVQKTLDAFRNGSS